MSDWLYVNILENKLYYVVALEWILYKYRVAQKNVYALYSSSLE